MKVASGLAGLLVAGQPTVPAHLEPAQPCQPAQPQEVVDLLAQPDRIAPGIQFRLPNRPEVFTIQGSQKGDFDQAQRLRTSLEMARKANLSVPSQVYRQERSMRAVQLTGEASTYGYGDGLYGQLTSSGKRAVDGVAALEMDLAHALSAQGAIPYSMSGVKAVVEFPGGRKVTKNLADKGGLYNPISESGWRAKLMNAPVNEAGVADLGSVPYRIIDIVAPLNKYPRVTITVPLHRPIKVNSELPPAQALQRLSQWASDQGGRPSSTLQCQA